MNKYVKMFLQRGLAFGGFGPVIAAIVYAIVGASTKEYLVSTNSFLIATLTTYVLAFVVAGCSILYNIEKWSFAKASLVHFVALYFAYLLVYVANGWFPFNLIGFGVFTLIFVGGYFIIWLSIYLSIKNASNKLNKKINS